MKIRHPTDPDQKAAIFERMAHAMQAVKPVRQDIGNRIVSICGEEGQRGLTRMLSSQERVDLRACKQRIRGYVEAVLSAKLDE